MKTRPVAWELFHADGQTDRQTDIKGKVHLITGHEGTKVEYRRISTLSLTSALDGGGWSTSRPGRFTPGKDPVPIVKEAGWAPGPVYMGAENLASHRDSIPEPPN